MCVNQTPMLCGHRSVFCCTSCHVHICRNVYDYYSMTCFEKWHVAKTLRIQVMKQPRNKTVLPQPIRSVSTPGQDPALHGLNMQTRRVFADRSSRDPGLSRNIQTGDISSDNRNAVLPCAATAPPRPTVGPERGSAGSARHDTLPMSLRRSHRPAVTAPSATSIDAQGQPPRPSNRARRS